MEAQRHSLHPDQALPYVEQLTDYRDLMIELARAAGRGVHVSARRPGVEFMMPGSVTTWSQPDLQGRIHIEEDRQYSASFRALSEAACRMLVIESKSLLLPEGDRYRTYRDIFRFTWGEEVRALDADMISVEILSSAAVEGVFDPQADRLPVTFKLGTLDGGQATLRMMEHCPVTEVGMDCLLSRTDSFKQALCDDDTSSVASVQLAS